MVQGTFSPPSRVLSLLSGYAASAVAAGQVLAKAVMPCDARVGGVQASAGAAGTGGGSTVLDVLVDGVSVYGAAADKPALAATATGDFVSRRPSSRALRVGAEVALVALSVSSTGHAQLAFTLAIERP